MAIFQLYSTRQKALRGEAPDVYQYEQIPAALRVQIVLILQGVLGNEIEYYQQSAVKNAYVTMVNILRREYGVFQLPAAAKYGNDQHFTEFFDSFLQEKDIETTLDYVELAFKGVDLLTRKFSYLHKDKSSKLADDAIEELNRRFKAHGVGYQFIAGIIVRVDSELIHAEVIKPALQLLHQAHFAGAHEEFLKAHEHYRHGHNKEALNECLKSFESVMKSICQKRQWTYQPSATAKNLIDICLQHELIPSFWQSYFTSLRTMLESSVPTGRNKLSGHGQGSEPVEVPNHLVAFMLHMTAACIVFLADAEAKLS